LSINNICKVTMLKVKREVFAYKEIFLRTTTNFTFTLWDIRDLFYIL